MPRRTGTSSQIIVSLLVVAVAPLFTGISCTSGKANPAPVSPPLPPHATYWIDEADVFVDNPTCGLSSSLTTNAVTLGFEAKMTGVSWTGLRRTTSTGVRPSDWVDNSLSIWGSDSVGADGANIAVYAGHGGIPESSAFAPWDIYPPH